MRGVVREHSTLRLRALLAALLAFTAWSTGAQAVSPTAPSTALSDSYSGVTGVTYTFGGYTVDNGEMATGMAVTFPAGTDLAAVTLIAPAGTLSVAGQTVTVTFDPRLLKGSPITLSLGGITNPATAGTYSVGDAANPGTITFFTANPNNNQQRAPQYHPSPAYTIAASFLSLSLTTPDPDYSVAFGVIEPGTTAGPKTVQLLVASSAQYTITRVIGGAWADLGLQITGDADGTKPAGTTTHIDQYVIAPPWETDGGVPLAATVVYSVVW